MLLALGKVGEMASSRPRGGIPAHRSVLVPVAGAMCELAQLMGTRRRGWEFEGIEEDTPGAARSRAMTLQASFGLPLPRFRG